VDRDLDGLWLLRRCRSRGTNRNCFFFFEGEVDLRFVVLDEFRDGRAEESEDKAMRDVDDDR
jgi:hypothetical protein